MEILAPAGNLEKIKYALAYGADAVYAGSQSFSLRANADNLDSNDLLSAVNYCHSKGKKLFIPLNIYAHNKHIESIKVYIKLLNDIKVDAVIVSDLGIFDLVKNIAPEIPIHISTQANVTSYNTVKVFHRLGAKRIILARELTFSEIQEIRQKCPDIELEIFVHGAMCISYSGRCLISAYINNRSANRGECTHPCRWKYALVEESRPSEYFPIEEDSNGFYFMNSKDLCLINRLKEIYDAGINSVKIEGRMKSLYYISAVTRAYKQSLLEIMNNKSIDDYWINELSKISHRIYTEAFFDEFNTNYTQNYETAQYNREWQFVGTFINNQDSNHVYLVKSYGKITREETIELIFPDRHFDLEIANPILYDENMNEIDFTKPNTCFYIKVEKEVPDYGIIRKKLL